MVILLENAKDLAKVMKTDIKAKPGNYVGGQGDEQRNSICFDGRIAVIFYGKMLRRTLF